MSAASRPPGKRRILIVDDHPIVRRGFGQLINHEPDMEICGEAEDIDGALDALPRLQPDLAIVDIMLKNASGLDLVRQIRHDHPAVSVLVVSMHDETVYAERALRVGARGYVMKQEADEVIVDAVRRILAGGIFVSSAINERILQRFADRPATEGISPQELLTDRELQVFELIGQGNSTRRIAERTQISIKTVESYRARIKRKLGLDTGAELVQAAVEWNLRLGSR